MVDSTELLEKWIEAFNGKKLDEVVNCYAENAVNFQVANQQPSVGVEQIRFDTKEFFKGFPDAWAKAENLISDGDWAAWEWTGGGTFLGDFYDNKPTGKSFQMRGCGFFNFKDDKIVLQRGYWDKHTWFSQIGIEIK